MATRAKRRKTQPWRVLIALWLILLVAGGVLASNNSMQNPFRVLTSLTNAGGEGEGRGTRPEGSEGSSTEGKARGGGDFRGGFNTITLNWNQFNTVTYDWWYIGLVSALFMSGGMLWTAFRQRMATRGQPLLTT